MPIVALKPVVVFSVIWIWQHEGLMCSMWFCWFLLSVNTQIRADISRFTSLMCRQKGAHFGVTVHRLSTHSLFGSLLYIPDSSSNALFIAWQPRKNVDSFCRSPTCGRSRSGLLIETDKTMLCFSLQRSGMPRPSTAWKFSPPRSPPPR